MARKKRISMKKVEADVRRIEAKEEYELKDGNSMWFYPEFSPDKIDLLINEYQDDISEMKEAQIDIDDNYATKYLYFLMVKHFTEYGEHLSPDLKVKIQQCNALFINGHISEIMTEVFVEKQIYKVLDQLAQRVALNQYVLHFDEQVSRNFRNLELRNQDAIQGAFKEGKKHTKKVKQQQKRQEQKKLSDDDADR
ncbi:hypothetical protein P8825_14565 [Shouchella clausii]|uniref:hypothetical protein n=1 Tax=Shouchella clausii TaxID=79880 RepID=UPI002DB731BE|nr:hypothetical protein [Shouchella clausii]MEB5480787.1 hypothetical protein [Shouchella clausii]